MLYRIKLTHFHTLTTVFLFSFIAHFSFSQKDTQWHIDSLYGIYPSAPDDSSRIRINNFLSYYYLNLDTPSSIDSSLATIERALDLMRKPKNIELYNYGYIQAAGLYSKMKDFSKETASYIEYLQAAQSIKNYNWEGDALASLCRLFHQLKDYQNAEKYAKQLEEVLPKMDNASLKFNATNKLGSYYKDTGENERALSTHLQAMENALSRNNKQDISYSYNNIGLVYKNLENYDKALEYYMKSLEIKEELNDQRGLAGSYINTSYIYLLRNEYEKACEFALTGLEFADKVDAYEFKLVGLEHLFKSYRELKKYEDATETADELIILIKEVYDKNIIEQTQELEKQYETEKKKQELELVKKDSELKALEIEQQQENIDYQEKLILFFALSFTIFIILLFFLFRAIRQKQKANALLAENVEVIQNQKNKVESQKQILEEKNKEILDSINYAKRIQTAILPQKHIINSYFKDHFIFYAPKDIVAGDFYWFEKVNNTYFVAAADCTGHGVPGAMVSVICNNGLNKSIREYNLNQPKEILSKTREVVISQFEKSDENVQDGMDISLVSITEHSSGQFSISFSGANNSIWVLRKDADEIEEIKGDKQPIGKYHNMIDFTQHDFNLNAGDTLYLFTDGIVDQFGGDSVDARKNGGKKFKSSKLKTTLLSLRNKNTQEQLPLIKNEFNEWKGELEQIDDVCLIGIRL